VLAAIGKDDTQKEVESMANKILKAKLWDNDEGGKWKWGVKDIEGEVLCGMPSSLYQQYHLLINPQYHNLLCLPLSRRATNQISTSLPTERKRRSSTTNSSRKYKPCTKQTESKMASSKP
jgi:D-Tyr-tRNAtyr deacylase